MNKANIDKLIDVLETLEDPQFHMHDIGRPILGRERRPCGTAGCIIGWSAAIMAAEGDPVRHDERCASVQRWLDLDHLKFEELCDPSSRTAESDAIEGMPTHVSRERALRQLRRLRETETVNWAATPAEQVIGNQPNRKQQGNR